MYQKEPYEFAIDKPSFKFLKFFEKYYNLKYFKPQSNNYVIFDDFFIYHKDTKISKNYDFYIESFEKRKLQDLKNKKTLKPSNPIPEKLRESIQINNKTQEKKVAQSKEILKNNIETNDELINK